MARGAFPGQGGSCALTRRASPWRPALRFDMVEAHDRYRSLCRHVTAALRPSLPQARVQSAHNAIARYDPVLRPAAKRRPAAAFLAPLLHHTAEEGLSARYFLSAVLVSPLTRPERWQPGQRTTAPFARGPGDLHAFPPRVARCA